MGSPAMFAPDVAILTSTEWWSVAAGTACLAVLGVILWRARAAQQQYALDLAEAERATVEARERAATLARESQAKSEMLATISREVRSALNGIIGSADLLLDESLSPPARQHLSTLRASAESLDRSVNDVLDYSSLETGQLRIAQSSFELAEPLIEVVEQLSPLALLKSLDLVFILAPDMPRRVIGDPARLRQIVLNLTASAVKSTPAGRVVLRVGAAPEGSASPWPGSARIHISVSDTGPGLPAESQATMFERLGPASGSTRHFGGSGLELAISKRLVELMGGTIEARNLPESGFEVSAMIPFATEKADGNPAIRKRAAELNAVVLDDLAASRLAASTMLSRLGVEHDVTGLVSEAIDLLHDTAGDAARERVLLIDEGIASRCSGEVTRHLQSDASLRNTRVVMLARDPAGAAAIGSAVGATAVLRKPLLRPEQVAAALGRGGAAAPERLPGRDRPLVLVVDDDEISRAVASQLLQRQGCAVEVVVSGRAAIERTQATGFDLIFMDCQMPEMDGFEATRRIRATLGSAAPSIVALTANTLPVDRKRAFDAGMVDFIDKPVRRAELNRVLQRWAPAAKTTP